MKKDTHVHSSPLATNDTPPTEFEHDGDALLTPTYSSVMMDRESQNRGLGPVLPGLPVK